MNRMAMFGMILILTGFLAPRGSLIVQGKPNPWTASLNQGYPYWNPWQTNYLFPPSNNLNPYSWPFSNPRLPLFGNPYQAPSTYFPYKEGVSSSSGVLYGPGTIAGSSGPDGSFTTGTGNWHAFPPIGKPSQQSSIYFPPNDGVSSSSVVVAGPGDASISTSTGAGGSVVTGTGDWQTFPSVGTTSRESTIVLTEPGKVSVLGSTGPGGSFSVESGSWYSPSSEGKAQAAAASFPSQEKPKFAGGVLTGPGTKPGGTSDIVSLFPNGALDWNDYGGNPQWDGEVSSSDESDSDSDSSSDESKPDLDSSSEESDSVSDSSSEESDSSSHSNNNFPGNFPGLDFNLAEKLISEFQNYWNPYISAISPERMYNTMMMNYLYGNNLQQQQLPYYGPYW